MVPLMTVDWTKANVLTIYHHDAGGMNPNVLYDVLKVKPKIVIPTDRTNLPRGVY